MRFSRPEMCATTKISGTSRLLREEGPRKRPAGGNERVRETIGFSQELILQYILKERKKESILFLKLPTHLQTLRATFLGTAFSAFKFGYLCSLSRRCTYILKEHVTEFKSSSKFSVPLVRSN